MHVTVKRLNESGLSKFSAWLLMPDGPAPKAILEDPLYVETVELEAVVELDRAFETSFELGSYLHKSVFADHPDARGIYEDTAMWAWVSLAFIDSLLSRKERGNKPKGTPLAEAHYIYQSNRHAYKLIARSAWWMARLHGDAAAFVLGSPTSPWGDIAEAVIGRPQLASHTGFIGLSRLLYLNADGTTKKGVAGVRSKEARLNPKAKSGLGAMRRLALTLNQFGKTYNTRAIEPTAMRALLPREYSRWD